MDRAVSLAAAMAALAVLLAARGAGSQDMEPRAYSAAPIGTNFLLAGYARTSGSVRYANAIQPKAAAAAHPIQRTMRRFFIRRLLPFIGWKRARPILPGLRIGGVKP